ncbi:hypothetical protein [Microbulbifer sp. SSSA005]|uniref:hypothetical protein n=2 Tax=Microbulbifer TaxID=48073 RepID=UPI00403AF9AD
MAFPEGLLKWFVMGPVAAAKIVADQKSIQDQQAEMNLFTTDVSTLQKLSQSFGQLAEKPSKLKISYRPYYKSGKELKVMFPMR